MAYAIRIVCVGILWLFAALPAQAQQSHHQRAFTAAFGNCGSTCVVRFSPGGEVSIFVAAAHALRAGAKRLVVIDGPCISACAIFADYARERVCITERATFGFHKARRFAVQPQRDGSTRFRELGRNDPPHSADIARWVRRHGGFPHEGVRIMSTRHAEQFWRRCAVRRV